MLRSRSVPRLVPWLARRLHRSRRWRVAPLLSTVLVLPALLVCFGPTPAGHSATPGPGPHVIVAITGSAANGFAIRRYNGSHLHPPTRSEAIAECAGYPTKLDRVRCRVNIRTHYRDLTALKKALDWAHSSG